MEKCEVTWSHRAYCMKVLICMQGLLGITNFSLVLFLLHENLNSNGRQDT